MSIFSDVMSLQCGCSELYKAQIFKETMHNQHIGVGKFVAIKKIDKSLRKENIAEIDDVTYCVEV